MPSPAKWGVKQDWDLEGLKNLDSESKLRVEKGEEEETIALGLMVERDFQGATNKLLVIVA